MKKLLIFILLFTYISYSSGQSKTTAIKNDISLVNVTTDSIQSVLDNYEHVELPPLSVFLQSAYDHPSVQIFEARRDQEQAGLKEVKSK